MVRALYDPSLFAAFDDFKPADTSIQCIAHTKYENRHRCTRQAKGNTDVLRRLQQSIMAAENVYYVECQQNLQIHILHRLCTQHRKVLEDSHLIHQIVQRWSSSLEDTRRIDKAVQTHVGNDRYNFRRRRTDALQVADTAAIVDTVDTPKLEIQQGFTPYSTESTKSLQDLFMAPLKPRLRVTGTLYLMTRARDPGFLKIGYTTRKLELRHAELEHDCGHKLKIMHAIPDMPYAWRAESLVQSDPRLKPYRRWDNGCLDNPRCGTRHKEWFEVDVEPAIRVMNEWASFLRKEKPYDADGLLTSLWTDRVNFMQEKLTLDQLRGIQWTYQSTAAPHTKTSQWSPDTDQVIYPTLPELPTSNEDLPNQSPAPNLDPSIEHKVSTLPLGWKIFTSTHSTSPFSLTDQLEDDTSKENSITPFRTLSIPNQLSHLLSSITRVSSISPQHLRPISHILMIFFSIEAVSQGISLLYRLILTFSLYFLSGWRLYTLI